MRKFVNTVLAGALGLSMVAGVAAQVEESGSASGSATVNVTSSGTLVVAIDDVPFGDVVYSFDDSQLEAPIVLTVEDNTGSAAGWNVTLSGTDFAAVDDQGEPDAGRSGFPITNLTLGSGVTVSDKGAGLKGITTSGATFGTGGAEIASAETGSGMGHYTITYPGTLSVPGGTLVGAYEGTLTVSANTGP